MQKTELFIARVERDVRIIQAITKTLAVLELIQSVASQSQEPKYRLNLTSEISRLRDALRMLGVGDDEMPPPPPPYI